MHVNYTIRVCSSHISLSVLCIHKLNNRTNITRHYVCSLFSCFSQMGLGQSWQYLSCDIFKYNICSTLSPPISLCRDMSFRFIILKLETKPNTQKFKNVQTNFLYNFTVDMQLFLLYNYTAHLPSIWVHTLPYTTTYFT